MRTLSRRELNRALLARQLLLERAALPLPSVLERVGGLQAQYAPSMYIGLWSLGLWSRTTLSTARLRAARRRDPRSAPARRLVRARDGR